MQRPPRRKVTAVSRKKRHQYCFFLNVNTGRRKKGRDGTKFSPKPSQRFPHQNFSSNLVNVFHTKNFFADIVYVLKIWNFSSDLINVLWNVMNNCELLPRTTAWRAFSWLFSGTFCSAGPLSENFNEKFTTFYLEFFRTAGPLGGNFDKKFTVFYLDFLPRRAARREFW